MGRANNTAWDFSAVQVALSGYIQKFQAHWISGRTDRYYITYITKCFIKIFSRKKGGKLGNLFVMI